MSKQHEQSIARKMQYHVPFGTISVTEESRRLIDEALEKKLVTRGKNLEEFERLFAGLFSRRHGIAVSSGTDANAICCAVLYDYGAQRGDEIIVPALSFVATGNSVLQAGFKPVFVDVKRETLNIDVDKIEQVVTSKTRAIMPVHLMGKPADMDPILAIAERHKLYVIEDTAEAHGAEYKGRLAGTLGHMAAFSLYAAHIVTTIEGGIIITDDDKMAEAARSLRNHGIVNKFEFRRIGFSAKMNEIEAAVGVGNIRIFKETLEKRRRNLLYLIERFKKFAAFFITVEEGPGEKVGPHAFSVILKPDCGFTKDELVAYLDEAGVDSRNLFYSMPTQCPSYQFLGHKLGDFPEAEYCSTYGFHIGIHQDLGIEQLNYVALVFEKFLRSKGKAC